MHIQTIYITAGAEIKYRILFFATVYISEKSIDHQSLRISHLGLHATLDLVRSTYCMPFYAILPNRVARVAKQIYQIGYIFEGLGMDYICTFYGHF
jgi:hypothetical protein